MRTAASTSSLGTSSATGTRKPSSWHFSLQKRSPLRLIPPKIMSVPQFEQRGMVNVSEKRKTKDFFLQGQQATQYLVHLHHSKIIADLGNSAILFCQFSMRRPLRHQGGLLRGRRPCRAQLRPRPRDSSVQWSHAITLSAPMPKPSLLTLRLGCPARVGRCSGRFPGGFQGPECSRQATVVLGRESAERVAPVP